jgi:hypothetical protein
MSKEYKKSLYSLHPDAVRRYGNLTIRETGNG